MCQGDTGHKISVPRGYWIYMCARDIGYKYVPKDTGLECVARDTEQKRVPKYMNINVPRGYWT